MLPPSVIKIQLALKVSNILARQNGLSHRIVCLISCQLTRASNDQFGYWEWKTKINNQALKQTQATKSLPFQDQPELEPNPVIRTLSFPSPSCPVGVQDHIPSLPDTSSKQARRKNSFGASGNLAVRDSSSPAKSTKWSRLSRQTGQSCHHAQLITEIPVVHS